MQLYTQSSTGTPETVRVETFIKQRIAVEWEKYKNMYSWFKYRGIYIGEKVCTVKSDMQGLEIMEINTCALVVYLW